MIIEGFDLEGTIDSIDNIGDGIADILPPLVIRTVMVG